MTRYPVRLEDKHTRVGAKRGQMVDATLCVDVPAELIRTTWAAWEPHWLAGLAYRETNGLPPLGRQHWNWERKSRWLDLLAYRSLGVECEGVMQAQMLVITDGYVARLPPDAGKPIVYIDYVMVAPWNDLELCEKPRFGGIGTALVDGAIGISREMEYAGRIGLHSLDTSEGFYDTYGLARIEIEQRDRHALGLWYYELTRQVATQILNERRSL